MRFRRITEDSDVLINFLAAIQGTLGGTTLRALSGTSEECGRFRTMPDDSGNCWHQFKALMAEETMGNKSTSKDSGKFRRIHTDSGGWRKVLPAIKTINKNSTFTLFNSQDNPRIKPPPHGCKYQSVDEVRPKPADQNKTKCEDSTEEGICGETHLRSPRT